MPRVNHLISSVAIAALLFTSDVAALRRRCQDAQCCFDTWQSYYSSKSAWEEPTPTYVNWVEETIYTDNAADIPVTTLCDGFPRYLEPLTSTSWTTRITPSPETYATQWIYKTYSQPEPTCIINEADCVPFKQAYDSSSSAWEADPTNNPSPTQIIPCTTYLPCPTKPVSEGEQVCKLYPYDVTVYYWPVSTTGDFCAPTPTTLAPPVGTTKTAVISGTTFVSPSVYLQINSAHAARHNGRYTATSCGYGRTSIFLSFASAEVLSTRPYKPGTATNTRPWNLVDMGTPAPASNYFFGTKTACTTAPCETLEVTPTHTLDPPRSALMAVDPEWKYCEPRSEGFFGGETYIPLETVPPNWPPATPTPTPTPTP